MKLFKNIVIMEQLNFIYNKTQTLSLEELELTYKEDYPNGLPMGGIYHCVLIRSVMAMLEKYGLKCDEPEIVAADNREKYRPGVTVSPALAEQYGAHSLQAHTLRRIHTCLKVRDFETEEMETVIGISYFQKGIQVGFGMNVRVCDNMMVMGAGDLISNCTIGGVGTPAKVNQSIEVLLKKIDEKIQGLSGEVVSWREIIQGLKEYTIGEDEVRHFFAWLKELRIAYDTSNKMLHHTQIYPLNDSQINAAMERWMVHKCESDNEPFTVWDLYNILNQDLKPTKVEIPVLYPQLVRLDAELLNAAAHRFKGHFTPWGK